MEATTIVNKDKLEFGTTTLIIGGLETIDDAKLIAHCLKLEFGSVVNISQSSQGIEIITTKNLSRGTSIQWKSFARGVMYGKIFTEKK